MSFGVATQRALVHAGDKTSGDARSWYMISRDAKLWFCDFSAYIHCEVNDRLRFKIKWTPAWACDCNNWRLYVVFLIWDITQGYDRFIIVLAALVVSLVILRGVKDKENNANTGLFTASGTRVTTAPTCSPDVPSNITDIPNTGPETTAGTGQTLLVRVLFKQVYQ
ncbi:hypothetical protein Tco_1536093 [Tanacetum coccineum]